LPSGLDPAAPAARSWVAVQLALALRPELAARTLLELRDPALALASLRHRVATPEDAQVDLACRQLAEARARLLPLLDSAYPQSLAALRDPPAVLSVIGDLECLRAPCVAVVGPRAATAYGLSVARSLAFDLAAGGAVVVSGLARGVDAAAHEGALSAGGQTVAVQACGPERVYPASHRDLAARISRRGALVTEMPPGTEIRPAFFPLRNRTISALCRAVVVVEARHRSGSLITANHAANQGVSVLAVPGPIDAPTSEGSNALLRDGVAPVLDASDVLPLLGLPTPSATPGSRGDALSAAGRRILEALRQEPSSANALSRRLCCPIAELSAELAVLELLGCIGRDRDGRLRAL
jgi:DNA processing protein